MEIKKAKRQQRKLKMNIQGVSGSGKTYTALMIAKTLGDRVLLIDSEHASASIYSDKFDFDILELENLELDTYFKAISLVKSMYKIKSSLQAFVLVKNISSNLFIYFLFL